MRAPGKSGGPGLGDTTHLEQVRTRAFSNLRDPWGFADDERLSGSAFLMVATPGRRQSRFRDEELILSGGNRTPTRWRSSGVAATSRRNALAPGHRYRMSTSGPRTCRQ